MERIREQASKVRKILRSGNETVYDEAIQETDILLALILDDQESLQEEKLLSYAVPERTQEETEPPAPEPDTAEDERKPSRLARRIRIVRTTTEIPTDAQASS